jgi:hypothetical protein
MRASEQVTSEHAGFVAVLRDIDGESEADDDGDEDDSGEESVTPDPDGD